SFYGVPRTTVDIDIMVTVSSEKDIDKLVSALKRARLKVEKETIRKVLKSGYNILTINDEKSPYSVDIVFSERKFKKREGTIFDVNTFFQDPEELILAKLRMIKATVSKDKAAKDIEDVKGIMKFTKIDLKRVRLKAKKEGTIKILEEMLISL
ncbi:MAG: nucleotidyl transferase AbiEii/AbiGii toxin family protein, partial [Thermoproteota archaeon]